MEGPRESVSKEKVDLMTQQACPRGERFHKPLGFLSLGLGADP